MKELYIKNPKKILLNKHELEKRLKIKIKIKKNKITINGKEEEEYGALKVLEAIKFGFSINQALKLLDPEFIFEKINIKDITKRKNLSQIRARIIGTKGKTLKTLCELSGCDILLKENDIVIISPAEEIKNITHAITSLVKGSKQSNVYSFLEKHAPKKIDDLGLKK